MIPLHSLNPSTPLNRPEPDGGPTASAPDVLAGWAAHDVERAAQALRSAPHLSPTDSTAAQEMLRSLMRVGSVSVPDTDNERLRAVAGVQWAMERTLNGPEFIITPARATPLRTLADPGQVPMQRARAMALMDRLRQGHSLHLIFCAGQEGSAEQDRHFRREVLDLRYDLGGPAGGVVHEYRLPIDVQAFPAGFSGAQIFFGPGHALGFAVRAGQAGTGTGMTGPRTGAISLYLGPTAPDLAAAGAGAGTSSADVVRQWRDWLETMDHAAWLAFSRAIEGESEAVSRPGGH